MHIIKVILVAFKTINENKNRLFKSLIIPIIITLAVAETIGLFHTNSTLQIFLNLINAGIYVFIAITTHRIIILGPESASTFGLYKPTSREISFALHVFGLFILVVPLMFLPFLLPQTLVFIIVPLITVVYIYIISRLSLVFPAIAVDGDWSFSDSWTATKNYKSLMFGIVIVFPLIISGATFLLSYLVNLSIISFLISTIGTIAIISTLSSAYQYIKSSEEKANQTPNIDRGNSPVSS